MAIFSYKAVLAVVIIVMGVIWSAALTQPDGKTHLWILGSKGDFSLIIRSGEGQTALINPKSDPRFLEILGKKLPFFDRSLALVVLTRANDSSNSALAALENRYSLSEIWLPESNLNYTKGIKSSQMSGWQEHDRLGIRWQTWQVPGQETMVRLSKNISSLVLVGRSKSEVWSSWPKELGSSVVVGPPLKGSEWLGSDLVSRFEPELVVTDGALSQIAHQIAGEVEIVWDNDSWYIKRNP